ncbi:MAG TPA: D-sedoheptulose 7-phosphate isomerase [Blastocatellia bacterium]|nr:D-sedoheptulose 7-phosphate isomerase [Blastocatellia bacterium]
MEKRIQQVVEENIETTKRFFEQSTPQIVQAAHLIIDSLSNGGKVLLFGNGGSAADAQHIASELINRFAFDRPGLVALALTADSATITAIGIETGFDYVYSRQVETLGRPNDVVIGLSTSGNSSNVVEGVKAANAAGMKSIGLLGRDGGRLAQLVTVPLIVRSSDFARIQEVHLTIGHILCDLVERELFGHR